jgi:hypothetical protein
MPSTVEPVVNITASWVTLVELGAWVEYRSSVQAQSREATVPTARDLQWHGDRQVFGRPCSVRRFGSHLGWRD